MSDILWTTETCPACNADNLVYLGDMSDMTFVGVVKYKCRKCGAMIAIYGDEDCETYAPHVYGTLPADELVSGREVDGKEVPR